MAQCVLRLSARGTHLYLHQEHLKRSRAQLARSSDTWLLLALAPSPARPLSPQSKPTAAGKATMSFCTQPGREMP
jgi:hypothetical protein